MLRTRKIFSILAAAVLVSACVCVCSCTDAYSGKNMSENEFSEAVLLKMLDEDNPDDEVLSMLWGIYTREGRFYDLIHSAGKYYGYAAREGDTSLMIVSGVYLGQAYILTDKPDSMVYYFNKVLPYAEAYEKPFPLIAIYNGMGIHSLNSALNYNEALSWYYKGLEVAYESDDMLNYTILLSNIVWVYYLRHDPEGLRYAEEAYSLGKSMDSDYALYFGALSCAYMYYVDGQLDKALDYVREAGWLSVKIPGMNNVDALHAMILDRSGRPEEAERYFRSAFSDTGKMDVTTLIDAYQTYGDFLQKRGDYRQAVENYLKGLDISKRNSNYFCILRLYKGLSDTYGKMGDSAKAIDYLRRSTAINDTLFNVEKERAFSSMQIQYENAKRDGDLKEKEMQIMRQQHKLTLYVFLIVAAVAISAVVFAFYRRKNLMYRDQVRRYEEQIKREEQLRRENEASKTKKDTDKNEELFTRLENLMKHEEIWRDKDLSVEKLASMLDTNRSYISRMFSSAGTTYNDYVNSYRIKEAVKVLSDPADDIPLKVLSDNLGYSSISSFYRLFQKETGVPPSHYRKESRKLKENKTAV